MARTVLQQRAQTPNDGGHQAALLTGPGCDVTRKAACEPSSRARARSTTRPPARPRVPGSQGQGRTELADFPIEHRLGGNPQQQVDAHAGTAPALGRSSAIGHGSWFRRAAFACSGTARRAAARRWPLRGGASDQRGEVPSRPAARSNASSVNDRDRLMLFASETAPRIEPPSRPLLVRSQRRRAHAIGRPMCDRPAGSRRAPARWRSRPRFMPSSVRAAAAADSGSS